MQVPFVDLSFQTNAIRGDLAREFETFLDDNSFVLGPRVEKFEREFSEYLSLGFCVGVGNGGDAVELALRSVGVANGDEVILPANTFTATAMAVERIGAVPVLVDVDDRYLLIEPQQIQKVVTDKTRAIVAVDLYGQIAPIEEISEIAENLRLKVVQDSAQSHGAQRNGKMFGSSVDVAATSFYPGKNLGAFGDGGAVVTNNEYIAEKLRLLRNYGSERKYSHDIVGYNSRLDDLQAMVLSQKLRYLDSWTQMRQEIAAHYFSLLADVRGVRLPEICAGNSHAWHLFTVRVQNRDGVRGKLDANGVQTGIHYPVPVHLQKAFGYLGYTRSDFPNSVKSSDEILSLPIFPGMIKSQIEYVCEQLALAVE